MNHFYFFIDFAIFIIFRIQVLLVLLRGSSSSSKKASHANLKDFSSAVSVDLEGALLTSADFIDSPKDKMDDVIDAWILFAIVINID
tara:strand:+ start:1128 stop:1388 length:261 start_codon:yes stop_codon:yes gene_type:complete